MEEFFLLGFELILVLEVLRKGFLDKIEDCFGSREIFLFSFLFIIRKRNKRNKDGLEMEWRICVR